jgi:5-methylcytosine-specific restriction endonuclease McrA
MRNQAIYAAAVERAEQLLVRLERSGHSRRPGRDPVVVRGKVAIHCNAHSHSWQDKHDLKHAPEWAAVRLELFHARGLQCKNCERADRLEVHHCYYFADHRVWEYELEDLVVFCRRCHSIIHGKSDGIEIIYGELCNEPLWELARKQDEEVLREIEEWEIDAKLGLHADPTLTFDEDNAGLWEEDNSADPADLAFDRMVLADRYCEDYEGEDD